MSNNKSFVILFFLVFAIAVSGVFGCFYLLNNQTNLEEEIKNKDMILGVQEGNVFNLRDDIAVLQDSLRLIRIGEIKIDQPVIDTLNEK